MVPSRCKGQVGGGSFTTARFRAQPSSLSTASFVQHTEAMTIVTMPTLCARIAGPGMRRRRKRSVRATAKRSVRATSASAPCCDAAARARQYSTSTAALAGRFSQRGGRHHPRNYSHIESNTFTARVVATAMSVTPSPLKSPTASAMANCVSWPPTVYVTGAPTTRPRRSGRPRPASARSARSNRAANHHRQIRFAVSVEVARDHLIDGRQMGNVLSSRVPPGRSSASETRRYPRRAASMVAMSTFVIVIIASKARLASAPPAASASVSARGVICQERPQRSWHQPH